MQMNNENNNIAPMDINSDLTTVDKGPLSPESMDTSSDSSQDSGVCSFESDVKVSSNDNQQLLDETVSPSVVNETLCQSPDDSKALLEAELQQLKG